MCGICGFTGAADRAVLRKMTDSIEHRGPDEEGFYADGLMNLGMRRLSIIDVATGHQPVHNEDSTVWAVFNGEIYNFIELREDLLRLGHRFYTDHSDTEVLVHLYEEYGPTFVHKLNGMFAIALWDVRERRLLLIRDRIGKKPLYYAETNIGGLVFASEIKAVLLHPGVSAEKDFEALFHYFGQKCTAAPRTAYRQVRQLLPGHMLSWQGGRLNIERYWKPDFSSPLTDISEEEAARNILALLEDAVALRMRCDVSYGAYLSGGIDSSAVVAIMSRLGSKPVKTFSLGYEEKNGGQFSGKSQDVRFAKQVSERLGTEHHEWILNAQQFAEGMPAVLRAFDEPFSGTVSTFFLSVLIKKHVKVALSGDGADELFGSYRAHRLAFPIEHYCRLAKQGKSRWEDLSAAEREPLRSFEGPEDFNLLKSLACENTLDWLKRLQVFTDTEKKQLLSREFLEAARSLRDGAEEPGATPGSAGDALNRVLEFEQNGPLPDQVLAFVDRLSMAHSVEVRAPFLDHRLVEFADRLPGVLKIRSGVVKHIEKMAVKPLLPEDLICRPKEGFVQPIYSWMHGPLRQWTFERLDALPFRWFDRDVVAALRERFEKGDRAVNAKLWNLVCFQMWAEDARFF